MKKIAIVLISIMTAFTSFVPAQAFPTRSTVTDVGTTDIQQVRDRKIIRRKHVRTVNRYNRRDGRHGRYNTYGRYNNHRRNNAGAVIGGIAAGVIIGGAIASQNRSDGSCAARYRSYRASDHTYQPTTGPRRVCRD